MYACWGQRFAGMNINTDSSVSYPRADDIMSSYVTSCSLYIVDGVTQHTTLPAFLGEVTADLSPSTECIVLADTTRVLQNSAVLSSQCGRCKIMGWCSYSRLRKVTLQFSCHETQALPTKLGLGERQLRFQTQVDPAR